MRTAERMLRLAASALPAARRDDRLEEWLADLEGSRELGLTRSSIVLGALRIGAVENRLTRAAVRPRTWAIGGAAVLGLLVIGVPAAAIGATAAETADSAHTVVWRGHARPTATEG